MVPPLAVAVLAELVGTALFQLIGGSSTSAVFNGLTLTVCIFMTAKASGGVLNPAVATALLAVGEMRATKWALYVFAECAGAVLGALVGAAIDPNAPPLSAWSLEEPIGDASPSGPGCVPHAENSGAVFAWELIGTFVLVSTVLATAVAKPGFGQLAPVAIGLSIFVNVGASGHVTGGAYNPARFIGPAIVYGCRLDRILLYWSAEFIGGGIAAAAHRYVLEPEPVSPMAMTTSASIDMSPVDAAKAAEQRC